MIQPRNTLIVVELIEQAERKVGNITIPTNTDLYCEAEVVAVGPGSIQAEGGRVETFDLKPGQRVLVKHQDVRPHGGGIAKMATGVAYHHGGKKYTIFEQMYVLAILAEPGPAAPNVVRII